MMLASSTGVAVDQPDPLARLQVTLRQLAAALPDPVGHGLVVDLLAQRDDVADLVPGDEGECGFPGGIDVLGVLRAADPEVDLLPGHLREIPRAEHLAGGQPAGEVVDRRAPHEGVVHVEERPGRRVGNRRRVLHLRGSGRRRARHGIAVAARPVCSGPELAGPLPVLSDASHQQPRASATRRRPARQPDLPAPP